MTIKWWIAVVLIGFQIGIWTLEIVDPDRGLIWLALTIFYHYPVSWMGEPLFSAMEMGPYPIALARVLTTTLYVVIAFAVSWTIRRIRKS